MLLNTIILYYEKCLLPIIYIIYLQNVLDFLSFLLGYNANKFIIIKNKAKNSGIKFNS